MSTPLGIGAAVAAGTAFATASVLQQWAAAEFRAASPSPQGLRRLAQHPVWRIGVGLAACSFVLQAFALSQAPLAIVQPLLVTELVIAIPLSAWLAGHRLGPREWTAIVVVAGGIAAAVWGTAATTAGGTGPSLRWALSGGVVAIAALGLTLDGARRGEVGRAMRFAAAAALLDALAAALLAATVTGFSSLGIEELARPFPYLMAIANIGGFVLVQAAFQHGPLAVTMPMMDWVQPLVAVALGVTVLGQSIDTTPVHLASLAIGSLAALAGIVVLDTSPLVRRARPRTAAVPPAPSVAIAGAARSHAHSPARGHGDGRGHDHEAGRPRTPVSARPAAIALVDAPAHHADARPRPSAVSHSADDGHAERAACA